MLYKQNISGLVCEILFSCLFTLIFILLVYYSNPDYIDRTTSRSSDIIRDLESNIEIENATDYYYYPNNDFIKSIVNNSYVLIKNASKRLELNLIGSDLPSPQDFNATKRQTLFAFLSFTSNFTSLETAPDAIEYSLHTRE